MQEDEAAPRGQVTPGSDAPGPAPDAPSPPPEGGGPPLPPPPYTPPAYTPPQYSPPPAYPAWIGSAGLYAGPRVDVGSVLGRTFDTFGREWSLFLVLALPAALASALQVLTTPMFELQLNGRLPPPTAADEPLTLFLVSVVVATAVGLTALACAVAADRLWRGEPAGIVDSAATAVRSIPRAIPVWLLVVLAQAAGTVVTTQLANAAPSATSSPGAAGDAAVLVLLAVPVVLVGAIVAVFVQVRLSLVLPVIGLETGTPLSVIPRTWRLTKGNMIALFACSLVIGLCASISAWGASMFLLFGENRVIAGVALAIAELVTAPLTGIWVAVAWGDLVGGRHGDNELMKRGRGRWTTATIVFGLGALMMIAGFGVMGAAVSRTVGTS